MAIRVRRSNERGHAHHGWLETYHTFSFAGYNDPKFNGFGALRVINEDRVKGGEGFGEHPHHNYEIFSYVVSGALKHNDSLNNEEIIHRGEVQFTSAGKGIFHAEYNASDTEPVHFLQIWVRPSVENLTPVYYTRKWRDEEKKNQIVPIVVKKEEAEALNAIPITQDIYVYATILDHEASVSYTVKEPGRRLYIHVVQNGGTVKVKAANGDEVLLREGDGAFIDGASVVEITGATSVTKAPSELLLFDLV